MMHSFKRTLTLLLTAGMLLSTTFLPAMAEEVSNGESQVAENPYLLPVDSPYLFTIEILDENDKPLDNQMLYCGEDSLPEDSSAISSSSRSLPGVNKIKLRLSIREGVEVFLEPDSVLENDENWISGNPTAAFEGRDPWTAGEISEMYTLGTDWTGFSGLIRFNGQTRRFHNSFKYLVPCAFEISARFWDKELNGYTLSPENVGKYVFTQDTTDDPIIWYCSADELADKMLFEGNGYRIVSINGMQGMFAKQYYILTGAENYITLEYTVTGEDEPHTTHLILCEEGKELWNNPFSDAKDTDPFYNALSYCHRNGLLKGTSDTKFSPEEETNRAMIVTTLYRIAGSPEVTGENPFTDVPADQWYTNAIVWANQNGIVNGYDKEHFGPMDTITREQFATILYRYAQMLYPKMTIDDVSMNRFIYDGVYDFTMEAADYAKDALAAAADNYILGFTFNDEKYGPAILPKNPVTRADLACGLFGLSRSLLVNAAASAQ